MSEEIRFQLRDLNDNTILIKASQNQTLNDVLSRSGIQIESPSPLIVSINDIMLALEEEGHSTLSQLQIHDQSEIFLHKQDLCGTVLPLVSFNQITNKKVLYFGKGPKWREIKRGVSFKGKCKNVSCEAYNDIAYKSLEFGEFDVRDTIFERSVCPICDELMKDVDNFGFWLAKWEISGVKKGGESFYFANESKCINEFYTFEEGDNIEWQCMKIIVKPLENSHCS